MIWLANGLPPTGDKLCVTFLCFFGGAEHYIG